MHAYYKYSVHLIKCINALTHNFVGISLVGRHINLILVGMYSVALAPYRSICGFILVRSHINVIYVGCHSLT